MNDSVPHRETAMRVCLSVFAALNLLCAPISAQVVEPQPPAQYHLDLRYRISKELNQRVRAYTALMDQLTKLGFVQDPREDADLDKFDPTAERLAGTIPSSAIDAVLKIDAVKTSLIRDSATPLPDDAKALSHLRILIPSGLNLIEQRTFHEQVVAQLTRLGFQEYVGYAHKGYSIIRGTLPSGEVPELLRDLRDLPSGWFFSEIPRDELNLPMRDILPIRLVEVLKPVDPGPAVPDLQPLPPAIASPKYEANLVSHLTDPAKAMQPMTVELLTGAPIPEGALSFRQMLRMRVPKAAIEGVFGRFAVVSVPNAAELAKIAALPDIHSVRLPRLASLQPGAGENTKPVGIESSNIALLQKAGYRGDGKRVIVLATEFPGELPKNARLIDLTAELSQTIEPAPAGRGSGTATAKAISVIAPGAELILVRINPIAIHQLISAMNMASGDASLSVAMISRGNELLAESAYLNNRRDLVEEEYRKAFSDLSDDPKPAKRRTDAAEAFKSLKADEANYKGKFDRLQILKSQLQSLKGADLIVNTLVWEDGYAHDGLSTVSQLIEKKLSVAPTRTGIHASRATLPPVWVQAASTSHGAVWAGPYLDRDGNGAMEYISDQTAQNEWARELNFLALATADGKSTRTIPSGTKVHISIQWREPRDPDLELSEAASFPMTIQLLRQIDPEGKQTSSDVLSIVAEAKSPPVRIQRYLTASIFEQTLEATIPADGVYAVRVTGRFASETLAVTNRNKYEIRPRLYASLVNRAAANRLVLDSYAPAESGVAIPGDATIALTVGIDTGLTGAGPGILLGQKPNVIVNGTESPELASGVVAGTAACLLEAGVDPNALKKWLTKTPGGALKLESEWIQGLPKKELSRN